MQVVGKFLTVLAIAGITSAMPKFETDTGKSVAQEKSADTVAEGDQAGTLELATQDRPPRFGFPTYTSDIQGYSQTGSVVPGVYGPVKLDIGGLLLGTIVGLGAFFILPKLLHVASPYGPYKRSEEESSDASSLFSDALARVLESVHSSNLDSTACLQRAICYSIQSADEKTNNSTVNTLNNLIEKIAKNDFTKALIEGTEWKKAVKVAESGGSCSDAFTTCPYSFESVASAISKYLAT